MAKFCSFCGRPLKEGEICGCPQSQNQNSVYAQVNTDYKNPNSDVSQSYQPQPNTANENLNFGVNQAYQSQPNTAYENANPGINQAYQPQPNRVYGNSNSGVKQSHQIPTINPQSTSQLLNNDKLIPVGQIVAGGVLGIMGLMCGGWDWAYIAYVAAFGFLWTGILTLIKKKK